MKYALLFALVLAACAESGVPTDSPCPTTNPPTYQTFGAQFMSTYCTGCHSTAAPNRHGAPTKLNFDTELQIKTHAAEIDAIAAAGPAGMNTTMPELGGTVMQAPSDAEREQLGQLLACMKQ